MEVRVYDLIQVGAKPPGVDSRRVGCSIRDNGARHEASPSDGSQFPHRRPVSAYDHRTSGLYLAENHRRIIAQLTLGDDAACHDAIVAFCSTTSRYCLFHSPAGAVAIDNNASEREMKRVVLNRKNSLFVGNPRGGRTAAILASLTSTRRRHQIDPQLYFTQLLFNLPTRQLSQLATWLPDQWKLNQSAGTAPA
jgi:hypothetical protein